MASVGTTLRGFATAVTAGLSCALLLTAFDLSACRAQDDAKQIQAAPKLIGRFSNKDASDSEDEPAGIRSLAISDDGKHLAILGYYGGVSLWDIAQATIERQVEKSLSQAASESPAAATLIPSEVAPVFLAGSDSLALLKAFVPDNKPARLQLQLWGLDNGKSLYKADVPAKQAVARSGPITIPQDAANKMGWHDARITASNDGTRVAVGINTSRMVIDMVGVRMASLQARGFTLTDIVGDHFPPSPTVISVLDVSKKRIVTSITTQRGYAPFALSADGKRLAIWESGNSQFAIFDVDRPKKNMTPISVCAAEKCAPLNLAFSADASQLVATHRVNETKSNPAQGTTSQELSKELYVGAWEVSSGKSLNAHKLFALTEKQTTFGSTAISADGHVAAGEADDNTLRIINTSGGTERAKLDIPTKEGRYAAVLSPNGRFVAVSTDTGEVLVWDLETTN